MSHTIRPFHTPQAALSLWATAEPVAAPSAAVIAAVLTLGDVRTECEDGRTSIRFSAERIAQDEFALLLGAERERALDVTVIWDEDQAEIVRVLDLAPLRAGRAADLRQRNIYAAARQRAATRFAPAYAPEAVAA